MQAFLPLIQRAPSGAASFLLAAAMQLDTQETSPVTVTASLSKDKAAPGDVIELTVQISVAEGWHINSAKPLSKDLVPTSVKVADSPAVAIGEVKYPAGVTKSLGAFPEPVSVYEGEVELRVPLAIRSDAKTGETQINLSVTLQPCDDSRCLLPETRKLAFPVIVGPVP
jgi:DsbC/DsbD-like thiol-disulfide interchange protein